MIQGIDTGDINARNSARVSHRSNRPTRNQRDPVRIWLTTLLDLIGPAAKPALPALKQALEEPDEKVHACDIEAMQKIRSRADANAGGDLKF